MRIRNIIGMLFVTGAILPATTVSATDFTFNGAVDNTWGDAGNWSPPGGPPGSTDKAIIPWNKDVSTSGVDEACKVLEIQSRGDGPTGTLHITQGSTFSLHGTTLTPSTLNGWITFSTRAGEEETPVLEIVNSMTIEGNQFGVIAGKTGLGAKGIIRGESSSDVLTWAIASGAGPYMIGEIDVEVELINNATVHAGGAGTTMTLKTNPKSGTGLWSVNGGVLLVDVAVTGTGDWLMDPTTTGTIRFTANSPNLGGDFTVKAGGTLDIQGNLCTSGDLDWTGGSILVDNASSTNSAAFGGACSTP